MNKTLHYTGSLECWIKHLSVPEHIKCTTHIGSLEYYSIYEMH